MKTVMRNAIRLTAFLLLTAGMLLHLNRIFIFMDKTIWSTDQRMDTYQLLPRNSLDVLFLGSSNVMSSINPLQLWDETGIQSYVYASRAQTFPFSYAYLKDALRTQKPKVVVMDAYSAISSHEVWGIISGGTNININTENLSYASRFDLIRQYAPESERLKFLFPLVNNHNYFIMWGNPQDDQREHIFFGYCYEDTVQYFDKPIYSDITESMTEADAKYLNLIINLCRENNIELYVIKTPVITDDLTHAVLNSVKEVCELNDVFFYDMSLDAEKWGFNFNTDLMNPDHINSNGAMCVTARLGNILSEKYDFSESATHKYAGVWKAESERMHAKRAEMIGTQ